jgi:hypothetical protein
MTTLPVREMTPIQQTASDVALRWDTYSRQQTNAVLNLLDQRLRDALADRATYAAAAAAALHHCAEALRALGVDL